MVRGKKEARNNSPEGVAKLGQPNRDAITKEMIKEYQSEQEKPAMVDEEAR